MAIFDEPGRVRIEVALDAAIANAALEDVHLAPDEQELIRAHQRGEITRIEFLRHVQELAQRKAGGQ
jgi:hypothetical protein